MNINATIIFQAINFGIAYLIFRFILLKPAYAVIVADNQRKGQLELLVAEDKKRIEQQQEELAGQWRASYLFFKQHTPIQSQRLVSLKLLKKHSPEIEFDMQQVIQMRRKLADAIVDAVGVSHESR